VLDEGAIEGRAADVGVGGDEPGREDAIGGVHRLVDAAVEARPHVEDAVTLDHHHAVSEESVATAVEGDDVAGAGRDSVPFCHGALLPWIPLTLPSPPAGAREGSAPSPSMRERAGVRVVVWSTPRTRPSACRCRGSGGT